MGPTAATLPCVRPPQLLDVSLRTNQATYSLRRMLGNSWLRSNSTWIQQDAETLVSVINHHLLAHPLQPEDGGRGTSMPPCADRTIQNDLKPSVLSCMHRVGSCFDSSADQQQRLGALADTMLEQQRLAIRELNAEQGGVWYNVCQSGELPLEPSHANAERLLLVYRAEKAVRLVFKHKINSALYLVLLAVVLAGVALFWWFVVLNFVQVATTKKEPAYSRYEYHNRSSQPHDIIGAFIQDFIAAVRFIVVAGLEACAVLLLLQDAVRVSGVVVNVAEGAWSVRGVAKWTLKPSDGGMRCMRCWGADEGPRGAWKMAQGDISSLRGCEVLNPSTWCISVHICASEQV